MAKKIKITQKQLEEAINLIRMDEANDNITLELGGNQQDSVNKRIHDTVQNARANGVNTNKLDVNIPNETALNCSKILTKSQILEARRKYLKENSNSFKKTDFLK